MASAHDSVALRATPQCTQRGFVSQLKSRQCTPLRSCRKSNERPEDVSQLESKGGSSNATTLLSNGFLTTMIPGMGYPCTSACLFPQLSNFNVKVQVINIKPSTKQTTKNSRNLNDKPYMVYVAIIYHKNQPCIVGKPTLGPA